MQRSLVFASFVVLFSFCLRALADEPVAVSPAEPVSDIESAKELNRKGLVLLDAGDYAGALPFFESSRALVRSHANTRNVALCLDALGRKQEALAMFETLLHDYPDKLDANERAITEKRTTELRAELAPPPSVPPPPSSRSIPMASSPVKPKGAGSWSVGVFLGYAGGPSLGSDVEAYAAKDCTSNCPGTNGLMTGARAGYRLSRLLTLEVSAGYLYLDSIFGQTRKEASYTYALDVNRGLSGGFGAFGASARWPLGSRLGLVGRLGFGGLFSNATATSGGVVKGKTGNEAALFMDRDGAAVLTTSFFVSPEVGFDVTLGPFVLGGGLGAIVSNRSGQSFGELSLQTHSACTDPNQGACAPDLNVTTGTSAYGVFVVFVPQVSLRFQFD